MKIQIISQKSRTNFTSEVTANLPKPIIKIFSNQGLFLALTLEEAKELEAHLSSSIEDLMRQIDEDADNSYRYDT